MQRSTLCRSRREFSNEYLLAKFGFDTAENEPCKVCPLSVYRSPRFAVSAPCFGIATVIGVISVVFSVEDMVSKKR